MRNWILKIHIYGGLLCSAYLLVFGLSSLQFNHRFTSEGDMRVSWSQSIRIDTAMDSRQLGDAVRDSLGLMGWGPWWEVRKSEAETKVMVVRPAKRYNVRLVPVEGGTPGEHRAEVEEVRLGYWSAIHSLHAMMMLPNSAFISFWGIYTEICTWVVLFSAGSGVYLWTARKSERRIGWILLGGGSGTSLLLMVYVYLWG